MSDRPIIFSGAMIHALLDGRKTQTRRLAWHPVKSMMVECEHGFDTCPKCDSPKPSIWQKVKPGDRLWVKEKANRNPNLWIYSADNHEIGWPGRQAFASREHDTSPSIHMPRAASRLTLEVTAVRIERLLDISEEDGIAEGVELTGEVRGLRFWHASSRAAYAALWNTLHGPASWDENPLVVALTFSVHKANIDALPQERRAP